MYDQEKAGWDLPPRKPEETYEPSGPLERAAVAFVRLTVLGLAIGGWLAFLLS